MKLRLWIAALMLVAGCQGTFSPIAPVQPDLNSETNAEATRAWPVLNPIPSPKGFRACCAFGYNLKTQLLAIPIPFYQISNVLDADNLGEHHYTNSFFGNVAALTGISNEKVGMIYTRRGGFIDISHVRDTADNAVFLFSQIWPRLGEEWHIELSNELASRRIQFYQFMPPATTEQRYTLSAYLAVKLAFELAVWHEIAQWYGYQSVPGFSEKVSAFSPEDLYSNLLGARLSLSLILAGQVPSMKQYRLSMQAILPPALRELEALSADETRKMFERVDGIWWDSKRRVPDNRLILQRDYHTHSNRMPNMVPTERQQPLRLALPQQYSGYVLSELAELQLWPGRQMQELPVPESYWNVNDFPQLAEKAKEQQENH
ncbi:DUF4056 domain-containing protein [Photorhabdus heterorhabditis]|uniref:DUF4056 domain-containing protein n=1 Tax=Photorhabdus heterorhabditis TaxID=880156 RepID=UPI001BD272CF|nr:DUF4056 domain-containing protein [Photorhabdus heterorhabditis]MBS9443535.1 DUF4056 domain-containing protein [Photorhabdus heterorhabditis]